jgi:glycosyltransferase involved in cell wall biosynthesis
VCYFWNVYEGRGIEYLIEIAPRLYDVTFLIVGGLERDVVRCRKLAREKNVNNVKLTSWVSHHTVSVYLAASDLLIMPYASRFTVGGGATSQDFTPPIKLFEYMASCRPILATSLPSISEILKDGVNAVLVESDSAKVILDGIKKILGDPALARRITERAASDVKGY